MRNDACNSCDQKCKTLADLKTHRKDKHEKEYKYVTIYFSMTGIIKKNSQKIVTMHQNFFRIKIETIVNRNKISITNQIGLNLLKQNIKKNNIRHLGPLGPL